MKRARGGKPNVTVGYEPLTERAGRGKIESWMGVEPRSFQTNNDKMNFSKLQNLAGWSKEQITELQQALHAREYFGYANLTADQKQIILAAKAADKVVAKARNSKANKQPVQTKLHYRWRAAEAELLRKYSELAPGEMPAWLIIKEEELRALELYQPVLDQVDTSRRSRFTEPVNELLQLAADLGRVSSFDWVAFRDELKAEFAGNWNDSWDSWYSSENAPFAVLSEDEIGEFRLLVRARIEQLTREVYPSVVA